MFKKVFSWIVMGVCTVLAFPGLLLAAICGLVYDAVWIIAHDCAHLANTVVDTFGKIKTYINNDQALLKIEVEVPENEEWL